LAVGLAFLLESVDLSIYQHIYCAEYVKKSSATIENITPPTERDFGGVGVYLVEVTFRLDEHDDRTSMTTQVCFEELHKVGGISHSTSRAPACGGSNSSPCLSSKRLEPLWSFLGFVTGVVLLIVSPKFIFVEAD